MFKVDVRNDVPAIFIGVAMGMVFTAVLVAIAGTCFWCGRH